MITPAKLHWGNRLLKKGIWRVDQDNPETEFAKDIPEDLIHLVCVQL